MGQRLDGSGESECSADERRVGSPELVTCSQGAGSARVGMQKAVFLLAGQYVHMAPNSRGPGEHMLLFIYTVFVLLGSYWGVVFLSRTQTVVHTATRN